MIKISLPNEIYGCIKSGWKMVNRDGDMLAYFTKKLLAVKFKNFLKTVEEFYWIIKVIQS